MAEDAVLLDTHVWWWFAMGSERLLETPALARIHLTLKDHRVFVSVMSIWELGMLAAKGRLRFYQGVTAWVDAALAVPGINLHGLSPSIAIESTRLPGEFHSDLMDRILVATSRELNAPIITADARILAYANAGHVRAIEV